MPQTEEKQFAQVLREELSPTEYAAHVRPFRADEIIFATGDVGDGLYVIETGRVQIAAAVNSSGPQRLASIGPGDFFGEMAVVDDAPRSATAIAETDTIAFYLSRAEMMQLLAHHPGLTLSLIREFSSRMRRPISAIWTRSSKGSASRSSAGRPGRLSTISRIHSLLSGWRRK